MTRAEKNVTLDDLPMFAPDKLIAEALVGKEAADKWLRDRLPTLASKPGFPPIDAFHGGRAVPLVKRYYEKYLGTAGNIVGVPDGPEDETAWNRRRRPGSNG